jgi:hypothetical protein
LTDALYPITKVPRDANAIRDLLSSRQGAWEFLLFAARLQEYRAAVEPKWRDYTLGYTLSLGPQVSADEIGPWTSDMMSRSTLIAKNLEKVISQQAQDAAFGLPAVNGDPELIDHMAKRLIGLYEQLIDWADDFRAARMPSGTERLKDLGVMFVSQPIAAVRAFVDDYTVSLENAMALLAAGSAEQIVIPMSIVFEIDPAVSEEFIELLEQVAE